MTLPPHPPGTPPRPERRPAADRADPAAARLFVAVDLEAAVREAIHERTAPVRAAVAHAVRWVPASNLHLTLHFLGATTRARVAPLTHALAGAASAVPPFRLRARGLGAFPNATRPRVLWVGIDACDALAELHRRVGHACAALGFAIEERPFHAHVTLARVRQGARVDRRALVLPALDDPLETDVQTVDLMESTLTPGGARYTALARLPLAGTR